jgi:hypothetical protein
LGVAACGGSAGGNQPPDALALVHIDSIEPSSATFGDEIVIRGYGFSTTTNTIGFGPMPDGSEIYQNRAQSDDGQTLRFDLDSTMGVCGPAFPPQPDVPCILIGFELPLGEFDLSVSNDYGISNTVKFTREITHAQVAEIAVNESPAYKQLTEEFDRWIDEYFVPKTRSESAAASYWFTIAAPENGNPFVEFHLHNFDPIGVQIPEEIEGYEVRVEKTRVITSLD